MKHGPHTSERPPQWLHLLREWINPDIISSIHTMPPRPALSTPLRAWRCPQCRAFSTTPRQRALGPEHPRYIEVPEPAQQQAPYQPFPKGRLPVPRDVFRGSKDKDKASDQEIARAAPPPKHRSEHPTRSRSEWQQKLGESRRQNLQEGLKALRARKTKRDRQVSQRSERKIAEREALLRAPEREDERLTTPSANLNLSRLLHSALPADPDRADRIAAKAHNYTTKTAYERSVRADQLHTLYMRARSFIVTPQQLDAAVDEVFGTPDSPRVFGGSNGANGTSKWAEGRPDGLTEMLAEATGKGGRGAVQSAMRTGVSVGQAERVKRVAERLTGGEMD